MKQRTALLFAGRDDRPDAFAPGLAFWAASSLSDSPMDGDKSYRLLRKVIGRFDSGGGNKAEVALEVVNESTVEIIRFPGEWTLHQGIMENLVANPQEGILKTLLGRNLNSASPFESEETNEFRIVRMVRTYY